MAKGDTGTQRKRPSSAGKNLDIMVATTFQNGKVREVKKASEYWIIVPSVGGAHLHWYIIPNQFPCEQRAVAEKATLLLPKVVSWSGTSQTWWTLIIDSDCHPACKLSKQETRA